MTEIITLEDALLEIERLDELLKAQAEGKCAECELRKRQNRERVRKYRESN